MQTREKRILIVENDPDMLFILNKVLIEAGYSVESCKGGSGIVESKHLWPDLFILDKDLPTIDGFAISKFLRLNKATNQIPIIMISSYAVDLRAKLAGADEFLRKPFELNYLLEVVDRFMNNGVPSLVLSRRSNPD